jgi:hypothetical protein
MDPYASDMTPETVSMTSDSDIHLVIFQLILFASCVHLMVVIADCWSKEEEEN